MVRRSSRIAAAAASLHKQTSKSPKQPSKTTMQAKEIETTLTSKPKIGQYTLSQVDRTLLNTALSEYKYVSPPKTICEQLYLVNFWNLVAESYPEWLAPNTITLFGYACSLIIVALTLTFGPNFPDWYWLTVALLLFLYQTADGSDGPQARRLKCGSALGELFDHGVDAIVTSFIGLVMAYASGVGLSSPVIPFIFSCAMSAFFFSNATLLHTSRQLFYAIDAQEVQLIVQGLLIATYFIGQKELWECNVPLPLFIGTTINNNAPAIGKYFYVNAAIDSTAASIQIRGCIYIGIVCASIKNVAGACMNIHNYYKTADLSSHITGRTLGEFWQQVCSMLIFFILMIIGWFTASNVINSAKTEESKNSSKYAYIFWFLSAAFAFADHVNHVLVLRVAKIPFPSLIRTRCFWLMSIFSGWNVVGNLAADGKLGQYNETSAFVQYGDIGRFIIFILCFGSHLYYSYTVGGAIAQGLGVQFFSVPIEKQKAFLKSKMN
jgi:phosphatidylglycerophosphate synthase